jgi:hypothetical protein
MSNSPIALARAASLAALLAVPAAFAFAADNAPTQQTAAPAPRQQAQAVDATAASRTNGNDPNGDDPYVAASRHEKFRTGQQVPARFSNEPNWNGPEYTGQ